MPNALVETPQQRQARLKQEALMAFYRHRANSLRQPSQPVRGPTAWESISMMHPAVMLDWVRRKIEGATQ